MLAATCAFQTRAEADARIDFGDPSEDNGGTTSDEVEFSYLGNRQGGWRSVEGVSARLSQIIEPDFGLG